MGTKVQLKNHQLGIYSVRNLDEAHNAWPHYYEDEALSRPSDSVPRQRRLDGYSDHNKQLLRQTILLHEATFRKQVNELHRLYRVQRDLMEETKRKWRNGYSLQDPAIISSPFSSGRTFKDAAIPASSANRTNSFFCRADKTQTPSDVLNVSSVLGSIPSINQEQKVSEAMKSPRLVIDLELPAEAHSNNAIIEQEAEESFGRLREFPDLNGDPEPENLGKLPLGNDVCSTPRESSKLDLKSRNRTKYHSLVDLNQPIEEICYDGARDLSSCAATSSNSLLERSWCHHLPCRTNPEFSKETDLIQSKDREFNAKSICRQRTPTSSKPEQLESSHHSSWFSLYNQSKVEPWIKDKQPLCLDRAFSTNSKLADPSASNSLLSHFGQANVDSDSSWSKFVHREGHIPNALQGFPSFNGCTPPNGKSNSVSRQGLDFSQEKWKYSNHFSSHQSSAPEGSSQAKSFLRDLQSESHIQSHLQMPEMSHDKQYISNGLTKSQDLGNHKLSRSSGLIDLMTMKECTLSMPLINNSHDRCPPKNWYLEGKNGASSEGLPWLKSNQACNDRIFRNWATGKYSGSVSGDVISQNEERTNKSLEERTRDMKSDNANLGGISNGGFAPIDLNQSALTDFHQDQISAEKPKRGIDMNSLATENATIHNASLEDKGMQLKSAKPISTLSGKFGFTIDLEVPIVSDDEEQIVSDALPSISELLGRTNDHGKKFEQLYSEATGTGAEILLSILSNTHMKYSDPSTSRVSSLASADTLSWFADIVTSNAENAETSIAVCGGKQDSMESLDHDGLDFFESMTLKLTEIKLEDFRFQPVKREPEEEGPGLASLLLPKMKRGQGRRRRQTRDFQKDILPGLATLSRYEVSEDLQTIGSLMRASGLEWHNGMGKQNGGRNGRNSRGRGRRAAQVLAVEVEEIAVVDPLPLQQCNTTIGFENDGINIMGWGRTRRCRRQRHPSGIIANPPLT